MVPTGREEHEHVTVTDCSKTRGINQRWFIAIVASITVTLSLAIVGWAFATSEKINSVAREATKETTEVDKRVTKLEVIVLRIDDNVEELLHEFKSGVHR